MSRYPPLAVVIVALVLTVFALPSALNLPQANPSQTLEYAPVPGDQGQTAGGNFAGLGLGSGGVAAGSAGSPAGGDQAGQLTPPPPPPDLNGTRLPSKYQCVGSPPRQTEDPLSPPCVGFYSGDNGGATHAGVSASEIRVIYYFPGGSQDNSTAGGAQVSPTGGCIDLGKPPAGSEDAFDARQFRVLSVEFNKRYQTYNRTVHFWVCYDQGTPSAPGNETPEQRRQDVVQQVSDIHPFAAVSYALGNSQIYLTEMAKRGVVAISGSSQVGFGSFGAQESAYQAYPGLIYSFEPAIEYRARLFSSMFCREVAGRPVAFSGNPTDVGQRKYGLLTYAENSAVPNPEEVTYGKLVRSTIESGCGVKFADFGFKSANAPSMFAEEAATTMATFKKDNITTVVDVGVSVYEGKAAGAAQYRPEWMIAGDGLADATQFAGTTSDPTVWRNAFLMTAWTHRGPHPQDDPCVQSALDGDPTSNLNDDAYFYCAFYPSSRQLFTAIQVAGPHLTPASIDQGFHAIPKVPTDNSRVPTCFYDSGDYTCVKDAMMEWWDPSGTDPEFASNPDGSGSSGGCFRLIDQGSRSLSGQWPSVELGKRKQPGDTCNGQY